MKPHVIAHDDLIHNTKPFSRCGTHLKVHEYLMYSIVLPRRAFEEANSKGMQARLRQSGPADRMDIMEGTEW